jgi:copper homeostasis protein CutC
MIHNSFDFSSVPTMHKSLDQDQNPSWISLKSLKDAIRNSSDRILTSGEGITEAEGDQITLKELSLAKTEKIRETDNIDPTDT